MNFLLDTNAISELVKPRPDAGLENWVSNADEDSMYLSVVTIGELWRGIERLKAGTRKRRLETWVTEQLFPRFEGRILDLTPTIAERWGRLMARSEGRGRRIGLIDAFLAATAEAHGMTLVTRNVKDYKEAGTPVLCPWEK